jgi:hypothetical protein
MTRLDQPERWHPIATIFPLLEGRALDEFVEDIRAHGLREPVWIDNSGLLIDGRNRAIACRRANVTIKTQTWSERKHGELTAFVVSLNLRRRHMNESQRAMAAAKIATLPHGGDYTSSNGPIGSSLGAVDRKAAADLLNVGQRNVTRARLVRTHGAPELIAAVERGEVKVWAANYLCRLSHDEQHAVLARGYAAVPAEASRIRYENEERLKRLRHENEERLKSEPIDRSPKAARARRKRIATLAVRGLSVPQIAERLGLGIKTVQGIVRDAQIDVPASRSMGRSPHPKSNHIIARIAENAEHLTAGIELVDFDALDIERLNDWIDALTRARRGLSGLIGQLMRVKEARHGEATAVRAADHDVREDASTACGDCSATVQ